MRIWLKNYSKDAFEFPANSHNFPETFPHLPTTIPTKLPATFPAKFPDLKTRNFPDPATCNLHLPIISRYTRPKNPKCFLILNDFLFYFE